MSSVLYRLGRWCATHAWRVIAIWVVLLTAVGAAAGTLGNPLSSRITIPDTQFQRVLDTLGREIPEAAGGFATVVLQSDDGAFTDAQRQTVKDVLATWREVPHVTRVIDPFDAQAQLDDSGTSLETAKTKLADGAAKLEKGRAQLNDGKLRLAGGEALLAQLEKANPDDPSIPALRTQVEDGRAQLAKAEADLTKGETDLAAGRAQYVDGSAVRAASGGTGLVSEDGTVAVTQLQFDDAPQSVPLEDREKVPAAAAEQLEAAGITAHYSVEITQDVALVGPGEILGLTVAILVLVVVLGSLVAAGLPLLVALLGVGVGLGSAMALTAVVDLNQTTPALALMLGLAVGIDYALFIVNRHRASLLAGMDPVESIGRAVGTAGSAVVFAGTTVVIALAALTLSGMPILAEMGLVAAGTVAVSVVVAVTVSPAVLRLMGPRVVSKRGWRKAGYATPGVLTTRETAGHASDEEHGGWYVRVVTARPWLTVLGVVAVLGTAAIPVASMQLGLPDGGAEPKGSSAQLAYSTIGDAFGPGMNGPVIAVATLPEAGRPTTDAEVLHEQARIATALKDVEGVRSVLPFGVSDDKDTLAFQIVPTTGPADPATKETVDRITFATGTLARHSGVEVGLTGQTVANIELSERMAAALPGYLLVVVGLSVVILVLVFRSVVVPLVATGGFLLSIGAAFGATVAVHQWGWAGSFFGVNHPGPILAFGPIILIGVLFGLAMDYQMFLVSGMHEARAHGQDSRTAVRTGFVHGAKVVTAAAVIMFSVFLGFAYSHLAMVRPIGFGLAVGVIVDAVLVRMTLTPAVMHLLGDRAWYLPRWLDRLLPDLDVEGLKLSERLASGELGRPAASTQPPARPEADAAAEGEAEAEASSEPEPARTS
ncbi:MMPL family transporter [Oryzobacter telluris]|uniref:MMPL family transporter n=1 Tax=Oryzobacter telluris TaxID=3149179 RepID=UPI00370D4AA7